VLEQSKEFAEESKPSAAYLGGHLEPLIGAESVSGGRKGVESSGNSAEVVCEQWEETRAGDGVGVSFT
jgi:hypothetical protein